MDSVVSTLNGRGGAADVSGEERLVVTIVLNWNRMALTIDALRALAALDVPAGIRHRLLLVDNGSTDGSVDAVRRTLPEVAVVALPENTGFARGANTGIRHALNMSAAYTLLVNNDTVAEPGLLELLVAAADAEPTVGIAVPTVTYYDRPAVVWPSAGYRRRLTLTPIDTTANPPSHSPYDVDWAVGCCMLVKQEVWVEVGLFDTRFRMYYEDHDLSLRVRAAGWRIVHVPEARIRHRVAASTGPGSPEQAYFLARSSVPYFWTHTSGGHRALIASYRAGSLARRLIEAALGGRPAFGKAHLSGLRDGLKDLRAGATRPRIPYIGDPSTKGGERSTS